MEKLSREGKKVTGREGRDEGEEGLRDEMPTMGPRGISLKQV